MDIEHYIKFQTRNEKDELVDTCSCGAYWSHPKERSYEEKEKIWEAHLEYAKHEPLKPL